MGGGKGWPVEKGRKSPLFQPSSSFFLFLYSSSWAPLNYCKTVLLCLHYFNNPKSAQFYLGTFGSGICIHTANLLQVVICLVQLYSELDWSHKTVTKKVECTNRPHCKTNGMVFKFCKQFKQCNKNCSFQPDWDIKPWHIGSRLFMDSHYLKIGFPLVSCSLVHIVL